MQRYVAEDLESQSAHIVHLDTCHRNALTLFQDIRAKRNSIAKEIAQRKQEGKETQDLIIKSSTLSEEEGILEQQVRGVFRAIKCSNGDVTEPTG